MRQQRNKNILSFDCIGLWYCTCVLSLSHFGWPGVTSVVRNELVKVQWSCLGGHALRPELYLNNDDIDKNENTWL